MTFFDLKSVKIIEKDVLINSRKFDNSVAKCWRADLIKIEKSLMVFRGIFQHKIEHPFLGIIRPGTISYEYFWSDSWFNIFRFHEPDGKFRNFYCNLNMPPIFTNGVVDYIDLDIDILVWKDFSFEILDLEEFELNSKKYDYGTELEKKVVKNLNNLLRNIFDRKFPFNLTFEENYEL